MQLYRGFVEPIENGLHENHYLTIPRKPKNSHANVHEVADEWFNNKFGIRARTQTIFCTPDIEQAKEYGKPYKLNVVKDSNCKLVFSPLVKDFIEIVVDINDVNSNKEIIDWLEGKAYEVVTSPYDLPAEFCGEVMLYCEKYEVEDF